jgi:hypothetical protein
MVCSGSFLHNSLAGAMQSRPHRRIRDRVTSCFLDSVLIVRCLDAGPAIEAHRIQGLFPLGLHGLLRRGKAWPAAGVRFMGSLFFVRHVFPFLVERRVLESVRTPDALCSAQNSVAISAAALLAPSRSLSREVIVRQSSRESLNSSCASLLCLRSKRPSRSGLDSLSPTVARSRPHPNIRASR